MNWEIESEQSNIALVGSFNPRIFHPEWLIRKDIVEEWDYKKDEVITLPDVSQFSLPSDRQIEVISSKFILRSLLASNHLSLKDMVGSIFATLPETPINKLGMNYIASIRLLNSKNWLKFGADIVPKDVWLKSVGYIQDLEEEKQKELGLWELIMNLPRPDENVGFVRVKLEAESPKDFVLNVNINNHIEVLSGSAEDAVEIIDKNWEKSLEFNRSIAKSILETSISK